MENRDRKLTLYSSHTEEERRGGRGKKGTFVNLQERQKDRKA